MTIREKLSLGFSLLTGSILMVAFIFLYLFEKRSGERLFENRLTKRGETFANFIFDRGMDKEMLEDIERRRATRFEKERTVILDADKNIYFTTGDSIPFPTKDRLIAALGPAERTYFVAADYRITGRRFAQAGQTFYIFVGAFDSDHATFLNQLRFILVGIFLGMLIIVALVGWWFAGRILDPFRSILRQLDRVSAADMKERLEPYPKPDELGKLVTILNELLDRIENAFQLQKTFVANVSHELKNPLTKITSQIEVTLLSERESEIYKGILKSILDDVREMNVLSKSLLDLSTVTHDPGSYTAKPVRIDELIWEVRDRVQSMPSGYQVSFTIARVPEDDRLLTVSGNLYLLRTAFLNLVENAGKYSFDRKVEVTLHASEKEIEVHILNHGPGIPAEQLPHLLEFGFRGYQTSAVSGYGIGLPLSSRIIRIHQGELSILSDPGKTTVVRILFRHAA